MSEPLIVLDRLRERVQAAIPAAHMRSGEAEPAAAERLPAVSVVLVPRSSEPSGMREYRGRIARDEAQIVLWRASDPPAGAVVEWEALRADLERQGYADARAILGAVTGRPHLLGGAVAGLTAETPDVEAISGERALLRVSISFDLFYEELIP